MGVNKTKILQKSGEKCFSGVKITPGDKVFAVFKRRQYQ
jgi:hypothetical protein